MVLFMFCIRMTDAQQAHLEMIQGIVNRLSQNSFLLKGWSVVLVSSLFALAAFNSNPLFVYLTYLPVVAFWGLDAFFLRQERLFRKLYDRVRQLEACKIDFSMNTDVVKSEVRSMLANLLPDVDGLAKDLVHRYPPLA